MTSTVSSSAANEPDYAAHAIWNTLAIAYTLIGYSAGVFLLCQSNGWLNACGVVLLSHALVYSAYLAHEFMHGTIFTRRWFWECDNGMRSVAISCFG